MKKVSKKCFRCGSQLYESTISGYESQCLECDEDFYTFEQQNMLDENPSND